MLKIADTAIKEVKIIEPTTFRDNRGSFTETFNRADYAKYFQEDFFKENESSSRKGVIRGIHFQTGVHAQAKIVRIAYGKVRDVAVDLRMGSPTYGKHVVVELSSENKHQLYIPRGFGHGFVALTDEVVMTYLMDNDYDKGSESGVIWNDPDLAVDWQLESHGITEIIVSEKDGQLKHFKDLPQEELFHYGLVGAP